MESPGNFGLWTEWCTHPRGKEKYIIALEAYCDESGIHGGAGHCVVAGFVGRSRDWHPFEEEWQRATGGVVYHTKDFFSRASDGSRVAPYEGWSDERASAYLDAILETIEHHSETIRPIGAVVSNEDFYSFTEPERRYFTGARYNVRKGRFVSTGRPSAPYMTGFMICLHLAIAHCTDSDRVVNFTFDCQPVYSGLCKVLFNEAATLPWSVIRERLGSLVFRAKDKIGGLQAADLLASCCYKRTNADFLGQSPLLDVITSRLAPITSRRILFVGADELKRWLSESPDEILREWQQERH